MGITNSYRQLDKNSGDPIRFDPNREHPLHFSLFLPTRNDTDGLSLIDNQLRTAPWAAYREESPEVRYSLCILSGELLMQAYGAEMDAKSTPDTLGMKFGEPHAHMVIPSVNFSDYSDKKNPKRQQIKEFAYSMSHAFTESKFEIIGPFEKPVEGITEYRPKSETPGVTDAC